MTIISEDFLLKLFLFISGVLIILFVMLSVKAPVKRIEKRFGRKIKTISKEDFYDFFYNNRTGDAYITKAEAGRYVTGGSVIINKDILKKNKELIKQGRAKRSATLRKKARVPGRVKVEGYTVKVGSSYHSLWHVTHGLPYRYILSDGELDGLMFMGTAHLNMGSRYDKGYVVVNRGRIDSVAERVITLRKYIEDDRDRILEYPLVEGVNQRAYPNTQYSMDDVERLVDWYINSRPKSTFKYSFLCVYDGKLHPGLGESNICSNVILRLSDVTRNNLIFEIHLANIY